MDHRQLLGFGHSEAAVFWQPVDDWTDLKGEKIEVHERGRVIDKGTVDAVTANGLVLWLAFDGPFPRRLVEKLHGRYVRVLP
ncbi:hypothetical protein AB4Y87_02520 [Paenarthrobacter sp. RAF54_2]|uniref:hypothetical protein n=1 Tax=Paenarthrobacter sp. RAF54_2 TaxID=3233061 RepID=UPI003F975D20